MPILFRVLLMIALAALTGWAGPHAHATAHSKPQAALEYGNPGETAPIDRQNALDGCLQLSSDCGAGEVSQAIGSTNTGHLPVVVSLEIGDRVERVGAPPEFEPPPPRS